MSAELRKQFVLEQDLRVPLADHKYIVITEGTVVYAIPFTAIVTLGIVEAPHVIRAPAENEEFLEKGTEMGVAVSTWTNFPKRERHSM